MIAYVVRRVAVAFVMVVLLTLVTFVIFFKIPANPAGFLIDIQHSTPAEIAAADRALGTNRPLPVQYVLFLRRLARGDLGDSWSTLSVGDDGQLHGVPVRDVVRAGAGVTASVVLGGALLLVAIALPLGALAARRPRSGADRTIVAVTLIGISTHPLVVGLVLRLFFGERWRVLPFGGYCSLHGPRSSAFGPQCGGPKDWAVHLVLPWATFALFFVALYVRMIRARLMEVLGMPFIHVARAKGASEWRIVTRHASRIALAPIVTMVAMDVGAALGLSLYVETVYGLPGLGRSTLLALDGERGFDLPLMLGVVIVTGSAIILLNLLADIAASVIDPTLRMLDPDARSGAAPIG